MTRTFGAQLRERLKTLRKKNASVVFATQSLADIETSAIAAAIVESCPTRLFLPNERAIEPQIASIYRRFGLNDRQIESLARATPKRDYYCQSRRGNRLFELGLGLIALAFTAASSKVPPLPTSWHQKAAPASRPPGFATRASSGPSTVSIPQPSPKQRPYLRRPDHDPSPYPVPPDRHGAGARCRACGGAAGRL